jgi:hypothetical protein
MNEDTEFEEKITFRCSQRTKELVQRCVKDYPELFTSEGHFIRSAIQRYHDMLRFKHEQILQREKNVTDQFTSLRKH